MDPFEVRVRFSSLLAHLSASHTSHQKAALFALKNREMDEDLHSCILEQLERNSMNNRANIMFFIDVLCEMAGKEDASGYGGAGYVRMMQRDIMRVVDAVCPVDGTGAANVRVVRKVLQSLQQKSILLPETLTELERLVKERDVGGTHPFSATSTTADAAESGSRAQKNGSSNGRLDKKLIGQRIEEDRERHKRLRESIWAVPGEGDEEMERVWEEASDIAEDDYLGGEEEMEERRRVVKDRY
ncbi:CTD kinase subunit gamma [Byssothecium circinans]|uniref:CTD kinase subunit gamma n=1 Tax=Byssothecium circinans TaxID=147558 RepID=A0A6A5UD33_9PLEO|nr:CTD kinase subunit gamma [Byssothecium circinans]